MRAFGELEATVMDLLWGYEHPATVRHVLEDLNRSRPLAYTTVMTVMDNLHRKGALRRETEGRAYLYEPILTREQHSARLMSEALAGSNDPKATLVHFLEQLPPGDAAALQSLLGRVRRDTA